MKTSRAYTISPFQSRNQNGSPLMRIAMMLARMGTSVFEIRKTKTKRLGRVFLPALALAVLCLISVNTARANQRFGASLNGAQETPPNGSTGTGYGSVILSDDQTTITVNLGFTGLGTNASDAHIHTGAPGVAGGITFPLTGTPAATSGTFLQQTFAISPAQVTDLQSGNLYFNIHSTGFSGGEIRGQILLATCDTAGPIEVEATAGTFGPTAYASLNAAFAAINAGTHAGAINIEVCANTTEGATPATLNSSGAGSASYTSMNIYPLADGVSISGNPVTGFGVIQLNGADNVTIDGDNPLTAGTNRNLTVSNTTTTTVIANSAIRIATSAAVTSADNNTIKNCVLLGNVTAGNAAGITSATSSSNSSFGIYAGGNGGATATTAPTAITSVTANTAPSGTTINGLTIDNNSVNQCARAIVFNGAAATVSTGVTITNNLIGDQGTVSGVPPIIAPTTTVYTKGIWIAGTNAITISGNSVKSILSYVGTTMIGLELNAAIGTINLSNNIVNGVINNGTASAAQGIAVSNAASGAAYTVSGNTVTNIQTLAGATTIGITVATSATSGLVEKNKVTTVYSRGAGGFGSYGINLSGNAITVQNNFVSDINAFLNNGSISTSFGPHGIRISSGLNLKIFHNSVNLFGPFVGSSSLSMASAFTVTTAAATGMDVRNNILVNTMTGAPAGTPVDCIALPSGLNNTFGLTDNNNDYFSTSQLGQSGTAAVSSFTIAAFDPSTTAGATNWRNYTSTLLTANTNNDNASLKLDPLFVSTTDLHIAVASPMVDTGASVGVTDDIDGQLRVGIPDIGADEPSGVAPPPNDIAATAIVTPAPNSSALNGTSVSPQASFKNVGSATQNGVMVQFTITGPGGYNYSNSQSIATITSNQTLTVTFAAAPAFTTAGTYSSTATVLTADANAANDSVNASFTVFDALTGGSVNVGTGQAYTSVTNPGGVFNAINAGVVASNITVNVTSDLSGETGTVALNEFAAGFTLSIKPSGAPRTITGSSTVGIIRLNGADSVTIDGSLTGGTATGVGGDATLRNLTVQNTNPAATAGAVMTVTQGTNGASNNTIKNVNVLGQDPTQTLIGIHLGGNAVGTAPTVNNNNNRVENCSFQKAFVGIFNDGVSPASPNTGTVLTMNDMSGSGANRLRRVGIFFFNENGIQVTQNNIGGIDTNESADAIGIVAGIQNVTTTSATSGGVSNALISRNKINSVVSSSTIGFSAVGIAIAGDPAGPNTISNNMISGAIAPSTSPDIVAGIFVAGVAGSNTKLYDNSISNTGDRGAVASQIGSYGIAISGTDPTVELKNNIFYNTQISGGGANAKSYAIGMQTTTFANLDSNYNDFFTSGANAAGFRSGSLDTAGTDDATLGGWQTRISDDANSLSSDPLLLSSSDLHLQPTSPTVSVGIPVAGITTDFDNDPRPVSNPDIGADELVQAVGGSFAAGTYFNASAAGGDSLGGNVTITNTLYLNGMLSTGANTLTLDCNASISGANPTNFVIGNLKKNYCGTGVKGFEVGTANGYSPVSVNVTAGTFPADFTVTAVQGPQPNVNATTSLQRYWTLTEGGDVTANLNFNYLDPTDIMGNEANYHLIRVTGGVPVAFPNNCPTPGVNQACVDTVGNQAAINGVTNFSDWTVGEPLAPTAAPASISGQVTTTSGAPLPGATMYLSGARSARTISDSNGNYRFVNVDTDNFYTVTPSILNYHFSPASRSFSLLANVTNAVFTGTRDDVSSGNVIDTPEYFVRQHYLDFLGREPDSAGLNFWSDQILGCGNDFACMERRTINVSAAYFLSIEFQETGGLVDGLYRASYGRAPLFSEFMPDTATVAHDLIVGNTGWEQQLTSNKQEFLDAWVQRPAFRAVYDNLSNDSYVDTLISHTGVSFTDGEREALLSGLNNSTLTRAAVLQRVAQNERFVRAKFNEAFVRMQYFGYLRRDPDDSGFHFWLNKLNEFDGNFEQAEMVKAFLVSGEYRDRFPR